jgi:hypothetical protein
MGKDITLEDLMRGLPTGGAEALSAAGISKRGRTQPLNLAVMRNLTKEDVVKQQSAEVGVSTTPPIQKLRASHHRLAQLLAQGIKDVEVSRITGYSQSRISILKNDPSFRELLANYKETVADAFSETVEKMKHVTDDALDIIHERLLDEPESFGNGLLIDLITKTGDRAGYAPVQRTVSTHVNMTAQEIYDIKNKVRGNTNGQVKTINQSPVDAEYTVVQQEALPKDSGPQDGSPIPSAVPICEEAQGSGIESQGVSLRKLSREEITA